MVPKHHESSSPPRKHSNNLFPSFTEHSRDQETVHLHVLLMLGTKYSRGSIVFLQKLAIGQRSIVSTCCAPIGRFVEQCPLVTKLSGEAVEGTSAELLGW